MDRVIIKKANEDKLIEVVDLGNGLHIKAFEDSDLEYGPYYVAVFKDDIELSQYRSYPLSTMEEVDREIESRVELEEIRNIESTESISDPTENQEIVKWIEENSWFMSDDDNAVTTRDHGNTGNESPGNEDIEEANRIVRILREKYPDYNFHPDIVDEWVQIEWYPKNKSNANRDRIIMKDLRKKSEELYLLYPETNDDEINPHQPQKGKSPLPRFKDKRRKLRNEPNGIQQQMQEGMEGYRNVTRGPGTENSYPIPGAAEGW